MKKAQLENLSNEISKCKKCGLCKTAIQAVPGSGNPDAQIVFIGEAPGFYEDQQGVPFVGRSGKLLDFMLSQIGLNRKDVWIGNIVKHRPPNNRDPSPEEISACQPFLTKQLEIIKPKIVVTLGRFSMNYFLPTEKISTAHGKSYQLDRYILYPVYHPAAGLRNPSMKKQLLEDFLEIPDIIKSTNLL